MKRKVTYLVKYMDEMIKEILIHTKDMKSQAQLLKNREYLIENVEKLEKKYDNIIKDIQDDIEKSREDSQEPSPRPVGSPLTITPNRDQQDQGPKDPRNLHRGGH